MLPFDGNYKEIKPVGKNILVDVIREEADAITAGGIILSRDKRVSVYAVVVECGGDVSLCVSPGDILEFGDMPVRPNVLDKDGKATKALIHEDSVMGFYSKK